MKTLGLHDVLETERCLIKIPELSEAEFIWNLITDDVTENMLWDKGEDYSTTHENLVKTRESAQKGKSWDGAVYLKRTGECIGRCGMVKIDLDIPSIEIGYWLSPKYWGQGIIPECVDKLLSTAFEELDCINAIIHISSDNMKSRKVAEKCGFTLDGIMRRERRIKGILQDKAVYTLLKEEYLGK